MKELLRKHMERFITLSDDEYATVKSYFTIKKCSKGSFLISRSEPVKHIYLVITGLLKLVYYDSKDREHIISFAMEDWWESDYQAWFRKAPASLALECIEDTEVYCMTLDHYEELCLKMHKISFFFLQKANRGHLASQERILSFLAANPRERYELLLSRQPALMQRLPKSMLASYLGVSRETLSRLWRDKM